MALRSQPTRKLGFAGIAIIAAFCVLFAVGRRNYGIDFVLLYFAVGLFVSTSNDRVVVSSYLKKGWIFAEPDGEPTKKALKKWQIDPINPSPKVRPFSIGGIAFVGAFILLWVAIRVIPPAIQTFISTEQSDGGSDAGAITAMRQAMETKIDQNINNLVNNGQMTLNDEEQQFSADEKQALYTCMATAIIGSLNDDYMRGIGAGTITQADFNNRLNTMPLEPITNTCDKQIAPNQ